MSLPEPKFNVGDWITTLHPYYESPPIKAMGDKVKSLRCHRLPMQIVERLIQDCPAGRQIHYKCRPHFIEVRADSYKVEPYWQDWISREVMQFNEIEVEAYTEEMEKVNAEIPEPPEAEKEDA